MTIYGCHQCQTTFTDVPVYWSEPGIPARTYFFCSTTCRDQWMNGPALQLPAGAIDASVDHWRVLLELDGPEHPLRRVAAFLRQDALMQRTPPNHRWDVPETMANAYEQAARVIDAHLAAAKTVSHVFVPSSSDPVICMTCGGWSTEPEHAKTVPQPEGVSMTEHHGSVDRLNSAMEAVPLGGNDPVQTVFYDIAKNIVDHVAEMKESLGSGHLAEGQVIQVVQTILFETLTAKGFVRIERLNRPDPSAAGSPAAPAKDGDTVIWGTDE